MKQKSFFSMSPKGPFEAGTHTTIQFRIKIGSEGLKKGGAIKITTPNMGWGQPHVPCSRSWVESYHNVEREHNPWKPLNTTIQLKSPGKAIVQLDVSEAVIEKKHADLLLNDPMLYNYFHNWRWWLTVSIKNDDLFEGDDIFVTYGNTQEHPHGIKVQPWDEGGMDFVAIIDDDASGMFDLLDGSPCYVDVSAGPPEVLNVILPSITQQDEPFVVRHSVLDRNYCPPAYQWAGKVVDDGHEYQGLTSDGVLDNYIANTPGCHHVYFTGPEKSRSNPTLTVADRNEQIFWGDLHAQSKYHQWYPAIERGDSHRSPKELYEYAKEYSLLDFVAITDAFSPYEGNAGWVEIQQAAIDCYEPGRFVSFKGWECGMGEQGDKCVIYRSAEIEGYIPRMEPSEKHPTASHALSAFYRNHAERVLTIPHSFMKYLDWSVLDPELDRVIEIYSSWGSYESRDNNPLNNKRCPANQSAQYIWGQGALLGVTAAGDSHLGYPGRSLAYADRYWCQCYKAGLCAVFAESLTRERVWDALYQRYCYGTTGARIVLLFQLNDAHMGQLLEYYPDDPALLERNIQVTVLGTDFIRRVDIIKNNSLLYRYQPRSEEAVFQFQDVPAQKPEGRDCYYIRVFQADQNAAWSSPIWVEPKTQCV